MPTARPVRRRPRRGLTPSWDGQFAAYKAFGPAVTESLLERDGHTLANADPRIEVYAVQAHRLTYWTPAGAGEVTKRTYTPDVVARDRDGQILIIEFKAAYFARSPKWTSLEPYIRRAYVEDHGARFCVFTEADIRRQPRLSNCQIMLAYRGQLDDVTADVVVEDVLADVGQSATIDDVCAHAARTWNLTRDRCFAALMRLALRGRFTFDMSHPLNGRSILLRTAP